MPLEALQLQLKAGLRGPPQCAAVCNRVCNGPAAMRNKRQEHMPSAAAQITLAAGRAKAVPPRLS